jgi:energy-coupling factor transporter ATP-binding protein EcfA2
MPAPVSNPFATRFTRPGRIEPLDAMGRPVDTDMLLARLRSLGGAAAIVGPHGSGKSTLLMHLAGAIEARGERAPRIRLRSVHDVHAAWVAIRQAANGGTACIDSWECMGRCIRYGLQVAAHLSGSGLLVTSHGSAGLPVLVQHATNSAVLRTIVRGLPEHASWYGKLITTSDIEEAFVKHGGNLRESLYELYDRFEARVERFQTVGGEGSSGRDGSSFRQRGIHEFTDGFSYAGAPERNLG